MDFFTADVPDPLGIITFEQLGGAVGRVDGRDTAFGHRRARHTFLVVRAWEDPAQSEENVEWGRRAYRVGETFLGEGVYVNYLGDEGDARIRAAYGPNYERLVAVKTKYDPTNFFRMNQNVRPAPDG